MSDSTALYNLLVATIAGLAVGIEREWSGHTTGPDARFAGIRTFALLGALGGIAGAFFGAKESVAAAVVLAASLLLPIVAYWQATRRADAKIDGTTEVAALLVIALGVASGLGQRTFSSGATAVMVLLLAEKTELQRALTRIDGRELRAALQFAVLALVVLPLLPDATYGPFDAFHPRQLWIIVLLFSGLNFCGYLARRIVGETRGYGVTGMLGGLVSSTAVALQFSRKSAREPALAAVLGWGVVAACTMLLPRVAIMSTVLQPAVGRAALPFLFPPFLVGLAIIATVLWRSRQRAPDSASTDPGATPAAHNDSDEVRNPLGLWSSIQMAVFFQLVLLVIAWVQSTVGPRGVVLSAALLGLTDMDALTMSMSRLGQDPALVSVAALAIGVGILSNTVLKLTLVALLGAPALRRTAGLGLVALGVASGIGLWLGTR